MFYKKVGLGITFDLLAKFKRFKHNGVVLFLLQRVGFKRLANTGFINIYIGFKLDKTLQSI